MQKIKVLFAGFSESNTKSIRKVLDGSALLYSYKKADTSNELKSIISDFEPHTILFIYGNDKFDCFEILEYISQKKLFIPVIIISEKSNSEITAKCFRQGAFDFILWKNIRTLPSSIISAFEKKDNYDRQNIIYKQLEESEKKLRNLIENSPIGIYRTTPDGQILMANPALIKMLGYSSFEDLEKRNLESNGYHPEYPRSKFKKLIEEQGIIFGFESRWRKKDNSYIVIRENAWAQKDTKNKIIYYEGIVEDVTEKILYQRKIERLNRMLRAIRNVNQLITHENDKRKLINKACQLIFENPDYSHVWLILFDENLKVTNYAQKGYDKKLFTEFTRKLNKGSYIPCIKNLLDTKNIIVFPITDKSCKGCPLTKYHLNKKAMVNLLTYKNKVYGSILIGFKEDYDITEEERELFIEISNDLAFSLFNIGKLEEEKERLEQLIKLETIINQLSEIIVITDPDGTIEYVNPAFENITGYTYEEVIGKNPKILQSGHHDRMFYKKLWDMIKSGHIWEGKFVNKKKDGSLYNEEAVITPIVDKQGNITHFVAIKRDVTEKVAIANQLEKIERMEIFGQLAVGIAHDFNNILQVQSGLIDLILGSLPNEHPVHKDLIDLKKATEKGSALVRQLSSMARKDKIVTEILNLNDVINSSLQFLRHLLREDIELEINLSKNIKSIYINKSNLEQILTNLCINARDAMPGGGKLHIETAMASIDDEYCIMFPFAKPGEYVVLSISDTGIGIPEENIDKIFEPLFTTKPEGKGTGLGLSTVYNIVKNNNGFIQVSSIPGTGTTFKIFLPAHSEGVQCEKKKMLEKKALLPKGKGETILVIEDDIIISNMIAKILKKFNYKPIVALDGIDGIHKIKKYRNKIKVIISDFLVPKLSGSQLLEQIRKIDEKIPVIIMSGYELDEYDFEDFKYKPQDTIIKPFTTANLITKVAQFISDFDN